MALTAQRDHKDRLARRVLRVPMVLPDRKGRKVFRETQVRKVSQAMMVQPGPQERMARQGRKVLQEMMGRRGHKDHRVLPGMTVPLDRKDRRVPMVLRDLKDFKVTQGYKASLAMTAQLGRKDCKVFKGIPVLKGLLALTVQPGHKVLSG